MEITGRRAARLLRVSTTGQDEDNQDQPTADYVTANGATLVRTYKLKGKSASKGAQVAAIRDAIREAQSGAFDVLVIRAIDRLDRRGVMAGWRLIGELMDAGVTVHSVADPELARIDDDDYPMAGTMISMKLDMARAEVKSKVRRINDTFRRMDDAGSFRGCPPIGYRVEGEKYGKRLAADPQREADVVQAFADATTGTSTTELGARLGMTPDAVGKMLRNKTYSTGRYQVRRADGVTVAHKCKPLVTVAVQNAAIAAMEGRRTGDNVTSRAIAKDDLSGAIYCPCGTSELGMHRYYGGGKPRTDGTPSPRVRRYRCQGCGKSVRADDADAAVSDLMSSRETPWLDKWLVPGDDHAAELDRVRIEYRELSARGLDFDAEDAERDRLRAEIRRLEALPGNPARTEQGFKRDADGRVLSEGHRWRSLDNAGRREWLTRGEFRIVVSAAPGRTGAVNAELVHLDSEDA